MTHPSEAGNACDAYLLEEWPAGFLKRRIRDHNRGWRIGRSGIIHALYFRSERCVFRLRRSNIDRSPNAYQGVKFGRCFTMQPNAAMGMGSRMDKALMKAVGGSKLAPITHRISDVSARPATSGRNDSIALHTEPIRSGPFVLLLGINCEVASRCRLRSHPNVNGGRHQASVTLHYVNVLLRERNQYPHLRRVIRLIRSHMVRAAQAYVPSCCAPSKHKQ
jgi:hypothetical protein